MNIAAFSAKPHLMFLGVRTTDLFSRPEIIELGIVDTFYDHAFSLRFNPCADIDAAALLLRTTKEAVADQPRFRDVNNHLYRLLAGRLIVTWGDFALRAMCHTAYQHDVPNPAYASTWIDAMRLFMEHHGSEAMLGLSEAANLMAVPFWRPDRTALDDAKTIQAILEKLG